MLSRESVAGSTSGGTTLPPAAGDTDKVCTEVDRCHESPLAPPLLLLPLPSLLPTDSPCAPLTVCVVDSTTADGDGAVDIDTGTTSGDGEMPMFGGLLDPIDCADADNVNAEPVVSAARAVPPPPPPPPEPGWSNAKLGLPAISSDISPFGYHGMACSAQFLIDRLLSVVKSRSGSGSWPS